MWKVDGYIQSLLSVSLVVKDKPSSSNVSIPINISLDARVDDGISNFIDIVSDSIPFTEEITSIVFHWSEGTP